MFLWGYRDAPRPSARHRRCKPRGRSSAVLGATITAVELPTAFPYFAAIAAVVGSGLDVDAPDRCCIVLFNVCFIAPLLCIVADADVRRRRMPRPARPRREKLEAHWPAVLAVLALLAGLFVTLLGVTGVAQSHHNDFGTFSRRLRSLLRR